MESNIASLSPAQFEHYLGRGIGFDQYLEALTTTVEKLKSGTTEEIKYAEYLPINLQRLKRGLKTVVLSDELQATIQTLPSKIHWLVITEHWCGDAAQSVALLQKIAEASGGKIDMKLVFRDENLELMDTFLTNGSRSIPKVIQLDNTLQVTGTWGPRPKPAQEIVMDLLAKGENYNDDLHKWYALDKGIHLQAELRQLLSGGDA